jgi:hypothetical protein
MSIIRRVFYPENEIVVKSISYGEPLFMKNKDGKWVSRANPELEAVETSLADLAKKYKENTPDSN